MAEKGSPKSSKCVVKQSVNVKMFAYDVLIFTAQVCGVPDTKLEIGTHIKNDYGALGYLIRIFAAVLHIALSSRDKWKRMFESRQKSFGLDNKEKIQEYLSAIVKALPEFQSETTYKILTSLALYSELIVFLNFKNIEFDFEQFLDMWSSYFTALTKNTDELFNSIFLEHPKSASYLDLIGNFIKDKAKPYGKTKDVSVKFETFSENLEENFDDERNSPADLIEKCIISRLGFLPHNPLPEVSDESLALYSSVLERDEVLPGNRDSSPEEPRWAPGFRSSGATGVEDRLENLNIDSPSPRRDGRTKSRGTGKGKRPA